MATKSLTFLKKNEFPMLVYALESIYTAKNILGIAHPKHSILLLVSRILEGNSGYTALLVASNQFYFLQGMILSN